VNLLSFLCRVITVSEASASFTKMGAMCGKAEADPTPEASRPVPQSTAAPAASNGHAPAAAASSSSQPATTQQPYQAHAGSVIDHDKDVQVQLNGAEPEFNAADADKQANGEEAYSFWDRNKTFVSELLTTIGDVETDFLRRLRADIFSVCCFSQKPERQLPQGSKASHLQHTMQATMKATLGGGGQLGTFSE
jgi:hypothetical protein